MDQFSRDDGRFNFLVSLVFALAILGLVILVVGR